MAATTIKRLICDALEDLSQLNLEKFIHQLLDRREEPRIPRSKVEGKNFMVVTDVIVSTFREDKGLLVTIETLKKIKCNEEASGLESQAKTNGHMGFDGHRAAPNNDGHFVDIHRDELIQRVSYPEPILDVLLRQKVIQQEGYNRILAKSVVQDQMRELFRILGPEGITESKQIFYQALKEKEPRLVEHLEGLR